MNEPDISSRRWRRRWQAIPRIVAVLLVCFAKAPLPVSPEARTLLDAQPASPDPGLDLLGPGFTDNAVDVGSTILHYVRGGSGPALVLIHGYPQDWYEWRKVLPRLARNFTTIAVDLRGVGRSRARKDGYDAATLAEDIFQLTRVLGVEMPYVAGHDIGGMVAYAYARLYPTQLRGVMILDAGLPGIEPWSEAEKLPRLWHFHFHQIPDLPELLVQGHQFEYFREFFSRLTLDPRAISDEDVRRYASTYGTAESLRSGFEFYRAFPANTRFNQSRKDTIAVPITLVGGDHSAAGRNALLATNLREYGVATVTTEVITDSGHYVAEERPEAVAALLERYAGLR